MAIFAGIAFCAEGGPKTVRVGYFQSENFQEGTQETSLNGYAYEYYQRVAQYTGWRYEYVFGSVDEIYQKFLRGEVDLMAGLAFSKDREPLMYFSKVPMGREVFQFMKKKTDQSLFPNPMSMQGKKIGTLRGAMEETLRRFLAENKIEAEVKVYKDVAARDSALACDSVNAAVVENLGLKIGPNFEIFFKMSNSFYFLCVTKKRPDLLGELNRALGQLMEDDPIVTAKLFNKYIRPSAISKSLTGPERAWLASHDTLKIGYLKKLLPYSDVLSDQKRREHYVPSDVVILGDIPTGMVADVFYEMNRYISSKNIILHYTAFDDYENLVSSIAQKQVDVGFPVGGSLYWAEKNGIRESAPVVRSDVSLVFKGRFNDATVKTFAINRNSRMMEFLVRDHFPDAEIKFYATVEDCLNAILDGEASAVVIGNQRASYILKNRKFSSLSVKLLNIPNDKYFGVAVGDEPLLKLLNRGIALMGDDFALNLSYKYVASLYKPSLLDDLTDYLEMVISISASFVSVIFLLLIFWLRRTKKQAARELAQNERLEMQLDVIRTISDLYHSVFLVDVVDNSFETIHTLDFVDKVISPLKKDAQKALFLMADQMVLEKYKPILHRFNTISEWKNTLGSRDSYSAEYEGNVLGWCRVTILVARRDKKGNPSHVIYISQEINEQKMAERKLHDALVQAEQANNAKTFFLNNMSHDIRTPMNAIIGFTALASSHIDDKNRLQDYLSKINTSSEHLLSLINDVLDMRRIESGRVKLEEQEIHLPDLLQDVKTIVQANVRHKNQDLAFHVSVNNENIVTDKLRLNQILLNLLSNAIKFTKEGGSISLNVCEQPCDLAGHARYEFRVKDNGIGISPKFQERIFEAFAREETSTVSGIQGTGLGMAITKNIVTMMGGDIQVISEAGCGTEFIVTLQFKVGEGEVGNASSKPIDFDFKGTRILLVEDNLLNQEIASTILTEAGFVVDVAVDGQDAVQKIQDVPADTYKLVLMDIQMPVMDGYEAARMIRKMNDPAKANVLIVAMTANAFEEDRQKAIASGMNEHLAKPIDINKLMETLADLLS
ncbi:MULTISPECIES: transporter substrate-binding domain-containing protein [unclassified Fibrobacter]|uniref:ATP-binding protein n=1 Tax=unclassified Fibrobacter TaxID=2634177 RepID=UPI001304A8B8|nr:MULTISPECIES: transporter substrate-binding domain-containing protein [unclassified Fibrobacter]